MSNLAKWPRAVRQRVCMRLRTELARAAAFLQAPRVLMIWEEPEEPWVHLALRSPQGFYMRQDPPGTLEWQVAAPLTGRSFLCLDTGANIPTVLYTSPTGLQQWLGQPLPPTFRARFTLGTLLSSAVHGTTFAGRLFFLDMPELTEEHLALADLIACQVAATVDQLYLLRQGQQAVIVEERQRLARNLHDGVLQSLAVITLQLQEVQRALAGNAPTASAHLREIQRLIADEQRDLRCLVGELRSSARGCSQPDLRLAVRLEMLRQEVERLWGLRVESHVKSSELRLPTELAYDIYYIVREALLNAARHASASAIQLELAIQKDHVLITVSDNGQGFAFQGHYSLTALTDLQLGPLTLKERVASLGGSLTLDSSAAGARLDICLPFRAPRDRHGGPPRARR
jgi:signal transduction histidine kinase